MPQSVTDDLRRLCESLKLGKVTCLSQNGNGAVVPATRYSGVQNQTSTLSTLLVSSFQKSTQRRSHY